MKKQKTTGNRRCGHKLGLSAAVGGDTRLSDSKEIAVFVERVPSVDTIQQRLHENFWEREMLNNLLEIAKAQAAIRRTKGKTTG